MPRTLRPPRSWCRSWWGSDRWGCQSDWAKNNAPSGSCSRSASDPQWCCGEMCEGRFLWKMQKNLRRRNSLFIVTPLTCWCGRGWPRKAAGSCCRSPATRSPSPPRWASSRLWPPATALLTPGRANRGRSWLWTGPLMKSLRLGYVSAVPVLFSGPFGMSSQYPLEKADQRPSNIYSSGRAPFEKGVSAGFIDSYISLWWPNVVRCVSAQLEV